MTDWNECLAVERTPGKVSGAWVFSGTGLPPFALYENLANVCHHRSVRRVVFGG